MEFGKGTGRKYEKPHPEWKEGGRMPIEPLPVEDIVGMSDQQCYERLATCHNVLRHDIFTHAPAGHKWTESALLHAVLARLEGHNFLEFVSDLQESGALPQSSVGVEKDAASLKGMLLKVCKPDIYQKMRSNAAAYQSKIYELRGISPRRVEAILGALSLRQEDLFSERRPTLAKHGGVITTSDLIRALELRIKGRSWEDVVSRIIYEGNVELGRADMEKATRLLMVQFGQNFSEKTKSALGNLLHETR